MKKFLHLFLFCLIASFAGAQSGSFVLGIEGSVPAGEGGCDAACFAAGICSPVASGNTSATTVSNSISVPADSYVDFTIVTQTCNTSTHGLDGGDDLYLNGTLIVDGASNTPVNYADCAVSGSAPAVFEISLTANRRDETVLVSYTIGAIGDAPAGCATPLPVQITRFSAQAETDAIVLEWATASEIKSAHFVIEKSLDGMEFDAIGQVEGQGNSVNEHEYTFEDNNPTEGNNYYRLKQVDEDGSFTYSMVQKVNYSSKYSTITIAPTAAKNEIELQFSQKVSANTIVSVYNIFGQKVAETEINRGELAKRLGISNLKAGQYFVQMIDGNRPVTARFMKVN